MIYDKYAQFNHSYHNDSKGIKWKNCYGRNKKRIGSESIDDAISECAGLRALSAGLRDAIDEMDRNRRSGKAYNPGAVKRIRSRIDETLYRLDAALKSMEINQCQK